MTIFFGAKCVLFEPLLGSECAYVCHKVRTEKEGVYSVYPEYKTGNWHTSHLYVRN